jgi:hypothetical protein
MKLNYWLGIGLICASLSYFSGTVFPYLVGANPIEPILFFGFYLAYKSNINFRQAFKDTLKQKMFGILATYCFVMFIWGILNTGTIVNVYADFRANLLFFFLIFFLNSNKWDEEEREKTFIHVLWGIAIFDLITMTIRPNIIRGSDNLIKQNVSTIAPAFLLIYYYIRGSIKNSILFFLIIAYEVVFSFMRNVYVISIITILILVILSIYFIFKDNKRLIRNSIFVLIFISISVIKLSDKVYEYWMSDGSRSIHSVNRSLELINGESSEGERVNSFLFPILHADVMIIPQGLGAREHISRSAHLFNGKVLSTNDSAFLYLSYHYGFLFCWLFTIWFLMIQIKILLKHFLHKNRILFIIKLGFCSLIILAFFIQSIFLTFLPAVLAYSIILSVMLKSFPSWAEI